MDSTLRVEVTQELLHSTIGKAKLFRHLGNDSNEFLAVLHPHFRPINFMTGERIFSKGDRSEELFFVSEGTVEATPTFAEYILGNVDSNDESVHEVKPRTIPIDTGDFFGESALTGIRRTTKCAARTKCELLYVTRDILARILRQFPDVSIRLEEKVLQRELVPLGQPGGCPPVLGFRLHHHLMSMLKRLLPKTDVEWIDPANWIAAIACCSVLSCMSYPRRIEFWYSIDYPKK